jgi:AAA family ATP:ADP antiporter
VEFQFSAIAAKHIQDPERLTAFFGFWFSTANALSFGIQLLLTQRIVSFLGVGRSLFILPVGLIAGTAAVLKAPVLWAGTTLKVMEISLKQSINKAATELLILPVPMAVKSQAKTYIDIFVDTTRLEWRPDAYSPDQWS